MAYFARFPLDYFNSPKDWRERLDRYMTKMDALFYMVYNNPQDMNKLKLTTHRILQENGDITGDPFEVGKILHEHGTENYGYARDPMGYEWFVDPLILVGARKEPYPPYGDCDDHAMAVALQLACVGITPYFVYYAWKPFKFSHVIAGFIYKKVLIPVETIEKTGKFEYAQWAPHPMKVFKQVGADTAYLHIDPELAVELKSKELLSWKVYPENKVLKDLVGVEGARISSKGNMGSTKSKMSKSGLIFHEPTAIDQFNNPWRKIVVERPVNPEQTTGRRMVPNSDDGTQDSEFEEVPYVM